MSISLTSYCFSFLSFLPFSIFLKSATMSKKGGRDLSQFNYGAMSSLVVNQGPLVLLAKVSN